MPVVINLRASGLNTLDNYLELTDINAQTVAKNVVIDRKNIVSSRRGLAEYGDEFGSASSRAHQFLQYRNRLLVHYDAAIAYDDGTGNLTDFYGSYSQEDPTIRIKYQEANGNLYFTTSDGVKKISATGANSFVSSSGYITNAGGLKAIDLSAELNTSAEGFLSTQSKVAYRVAWGTLDANNNRVIGSPSPREVITNDLVNSLTQDFNSLLHSIDVAASITGNFLLKDTNYFSTLRLDANTDANSLRTNLISLAEKLDEDMQIAPSTNGISNAASASLVGTTGAIVLSASTTASDWLQVGDLIYIAGFTSAATAINNSDTYPSWEVIQVSGPSVFFSATGNAFSNTGAGGSEILQTYNYRGIDSPGSVTGNTFTELEELKTYFNAIVEQLQLEPSGRISSSAQPLGDLASDGAAVLLEFSIPKEITTSNYNQFFYQVYRTEVRTSSIGLTLADVDPGDEMGLVLEDNPTTAEISSGFIQILDNTPDAFRGVNLYTNPNSGEGILQANTPPPVSKDITLFKTSNFYSNTRTKHNKQLTLLGIGDLTTAVTSPAVSAASLSSNVATLVFNSSITSTFSSGDVISLESFTGSAATLNGVWPLTSISGTSASFALTSSNFSTTAGFGTIEKSEKIIFRGDGVTSSFFFTPQFSEKTAITFSSATALANSSSASYFTINSANDATSYYVWYSRGSATDPAVVGKTGIRVALTGAEPASTVAALTIDAVASIHDFQVDATSAIGSTGYIECLNFGMATDTASGNISSFTFQTIQQGNDENPSLGWVGLSNAATPAQQIDATAKSLVKVINRESAGFLNAFYISGVNDTPGKMFLETRDLGTTPFFINVSTSAAGADFDPTLSTSGDTVLSDNEQVPNRIYFSKSSQPEAVPALNYFDIGPKEARILRILALRDSLFILKDDGIYRISGSNPSNFSVFLFDTSAKLLSPDTAVVLNNQIYALSDQGVITISDTGVSIISRPIENLLTNLTNFDSFASGSFGVNYDLDRAYLLWTVTDPTDTTATQCFRFNFMTNAWTNWPIAKTCGIVLKTDTKLYLGAADENRLEQERKSLDRTDYADRDFSIDISNNALQEDVITFNSISNITQGDVLVQNQYLTLTEFNRLLNKLDLDPSVSAAGSGNFYSSVSASPGTNLLDSMTMLLQALDTYTSSSSYSGLSSASSMDVSSPSTIQNTFNQMSSLLNTDANFTFINYNSSTGTTNYEGLLISLTAAQKMAQFDEIIPLVVGPGTIYKKIETEISYVPQHFGNPSVLKQVRDATFLFEANDFYSATASYSSDLRPGYESIPFNGLGSGIFGNGTFGNFYFGGGGNQSPLRTLIPQQAQRCRFINIRFEHANAREHFSIYGISLVGEISQVEARAYR